MPAYVRERVNKFLDLAKAKRSWPSCLGRVESVPPSAGVKLEAGMFLIDITLARFPS